MGAIHQAILSECGPNLNGNTPYGASVTLDPSNVGANITLSNGNLTAAMASSGFSGGTMVRATAVAPSGTSVFEVTVTANPTPYNDAFIGVVTSSASLAEYPGGDSNGDGIISGTSTVYNNGSGVQTNGTAWKTAGTVIGCKYTTSTGVWKFYVNGVAVNSYTTGLGTSIYAACGMENDGSFNTTLTFNFGASSFAYNYP